MSENNKWQCKDHDNIRKPINRRGKRKRS
uniref:Uncharacterized protein n=1 Tax=Rhizophora mucronata TaxID=61149 RepID=A0A2P2P435_RHIMU